MRLGTLNGVYNITNIDYDPYGGCGIVYANCANDELLIFRMPFEEFKMLKYCLLQYGKAQITSIEWLKPEFAEDRKIDELATYTWEPIKQPFYCPAKED